MHQRFTATRRKRHPKRCLVSTAPPAYTTTERILMDLKARIWCIEWTPPVQWKRNLPAKCSSPSQGIKPASSSPQEMDVTITITIFFNWIRARQDFLQGLLKVLKEMSLRVAVKLMLWILLDEMSILFEQELFYWVIRCIISTNSAEKWRMPLLFIDNEESQQDWDNFLGPDKLLDCFSKKQIDTRVCGIWWFRWRRW